MSSIIHRSPTHSECRSLEGAPAPGLLRWYGGLFEEERPFLVVVWDTPVIHGPFRESYAPSPLIELHVWLNRPLLSLLGKQAGDRISWSPVWWKDDADPYGQVILRRDCTKSRSGVCKSKGRVPGTVHYKLIGLRKARLWFPDSTITHYGITHLTPHSLGLRFNPLDGFQQHGPIGRRS